MTTHSEGFLLRGIAGDIEETSSGLLDKVDILLGEVEGEFRRLRLLAEDLAEHLEKNPDWEPSPEAILNASAS